MVELVNASTQTDPVIITSCKKRSNEEQSETVNVKKAFNYVVIKVIVPNLTAGAVLGRKGEDIINAQKTSGAVAKLSKPGEFYPGTNDRICLVSGEAAAVIEFCSFIIDKILSASEQWSDVTNPNNRPQVRLLVSNAAAGVIIGKNGTHVQKIKEESGAFIQLSQKIEKSLVMERCVVLLGSKDQLIIAVTKIVDAISQDSAFNSLSVLNYSESGSSSLHNQHPPQSHWPVTFATENNNQSNISIVSMSQTPTISHHVDPNATFTNSGYEHQTFRSISQKEKRIERCIEIPETLIGHIMGKGGVALSELKLSTRTDIKISKKGVYVPNTNNRAVTISGTVTNVDLAIMIITKSIGIEERRRSIKIS